MEEKSLKIELPINNRNAELREETAKVLEYFKGMVKKGGDKCFCLGRICSIQGAYYLSKDDKNLFNNDAIQEAIPYIKEAGYFVWHKIYASGKNSYLFMTRDIRPDKWYDRI